MPPIDLAVRQFIHTAPQVKRVLVACSGGVDSTVLLHCVAKAGLPYPVIGLHVNHQLSVHANAWEQQVQDLCATLDVACFHQRVTVAKSGSGVEQAARQARYRVFEQHLQIGDLLLTAHHQQDQAETFFLRLLRGAGLRGLGAMQPLRTHGNAQIGRPLLQYSKNALLNYARDHDLQWVEDESNEQSIYDRNFLRRQVLPVIEQRWPQAIQQISRSAQLLQEAETLLAHYAEQDIVSCQPRDERVGCSLLLAPLLDWPEARRNQVVRAWLAEQGYRMPEQKQFAELARLLAAQIDKCPVLHWQDCEIRRFQQRLYCLPRHWQSTPEALASDDQKYAVPWAPEMPPASGGYSRLSAYRAEQGVRPGQSFTVRLRHQCPEVVRAHPASRGHSQSLKKLLQEYQVEPWLRPWVPLLFVDDKLVAVADLWVEKQHLYRGNDALGLAWVLGRASGGGDE